MNLIVYLTLLDITAKHRYFEFHDKSFQGIKLSFKINF